MREKIIEGKLTLFSDQGMEGGRLAILNNEFNRLYVPKYGVDENSKVWDNNDKKKTGITSNPESFLNNTWLPYRDPILDEPDYKISSLFQGEIQGDLNADKRLMRKYNFAIKYVKDKADEKYGSNNWNFTGHRRDIVLKDGSVISMGTSPSTVPERPYHIPLSDFSRVTVAWENGTIETERLTNSLLVEGWGGYEALHILKETDYLKIKSLDSNKIICEGQINLIPLKLFSDTVKGHFKAIKDDNNWEEYFTKEYNAELYRETK
jgi:hypothetical protein